MENKYKASIALALVGVTTAYFIVGEKNEIHLPERFPIYVQFSNPMAVSVGTNGVLVSLRTSPRTTP